MLDTKLERVRFSREYAVLLLRYLRELSGDTSNPDTTDDLDQHQLNLHAHTLIQSYGDPTFGLAIGRRLHVCDYGAVGYAAMSSACLLDALKITIRYRDLICRGLEVSLTQRADGYLYSVKPKQRHLDTCPLIELELAACIRFAELVTTAMTPSAEIAPNLVKKVWFEHAQIAPFEQYQDAFGCTPSFQADFNGLLLDYETLQRPTRNPNPTLSRILEKSLQATIEVEGAQVPFVERVRAYLANSSECFPPQEDVAKHFCLSVSGLKARLRREGMSFRDIVEEERFKFAEHHLKLGQKSIKQISFELGFADQSSFNRAFKRWSGSSPNEYRMSAAET